MPNVYGGYYECQVRYPSFLGHFDPKLGAAGSIYNLPNDERLNHRIKVISYVMEKEWPRPHAGIFFEQRGGG